MAKTPEVLTQLDLARQEILVSAYIRDWVRKHPITDDDVQKEYERAKSQTGDKEYKARHILLETEDQAKGMIAELKKGGKFDELATKNSKDNGTKDRGGDLDWNVPSVFDPQFADVMVKLEKGKYTETPVRTRFGFHVIQLDDVRQGEVSGPRRGPTAHPAAIGAGQGRRAGAGAQGKGEDRVAGCTTQLFREEVAPGRVFEVVRGNLLEEPVEAIVNAANGQLAHGGGVAGIISRAAGAALQQESDRIVRSRGPAPDG